MRTLDSSLIDISGFAGIRERVLVQDRGYFNRYPADEVRDGFGSCVYLAHAYFTPNGSTGLHHHQNVDIISIFTRGEVAHEGTLGDGERFKPGQVLVQCSGPSGFSHNEINARSDISGMVQLWCVPSPDSAKQQRHEVVNLPARGLQRVYGGAITDPQTRIASDTQLDIAVLDGGEPLVLEGTSRLYVFDGEAQANENQQQASLPRGSLCDGDNLTIDGRCQVLIQRRIDSEQAREKTS